MKTTFSRILLLLCSFTIINVNGQETEKSDDAKYNFTIIKNIPVTPVKDQYKSGTCWSFAATSFFESELMRLGYAEADLSEMYFVYHAYLDKANRYVRTHSNANFGPGGQAHDVLNVIREFGFVTENEYPGLLKGEDKHRHGELDAVLRGYLEALVANKDGKLSQVWPDAFRALVSTYLGNDPLAVINSSSIPADRIKERYPLFNPDDYVEITSYTHHPFYSTIDLELPDNWSHDLYYNLPVDDMMNVIDHALKNGYTVCWDGDVSDKGFSHANNVAIVPEKDVKTLEGTELSRWQKLTEKEKTAELYSFKKPGTEKKINQQMRQDAFDSFQATDDHLMHLTGMVSDQQGTIYYITKNSWAANSNENGGYLNMSESYVRLNTIAIMVHKDAIPSQLKKKLKL